MLNVKLIFPELSTPVPNSPRNVPLIVTVLLYSVLGVADITNMVLRIRAFTLFNSVLLVLYFVLFSYVTRMFAVALFTILGSLMIPSLDVML